jgi:CRP-like cAMP-binding protein
MNPNANPELKTIKALAGKRSSRLFKAGDVIFRDGDLGNTLFGVVNGQIEISTNPEQIEIIESGSCFGAAALIEPEHRRFGTATALTDVELLVMNREEFLFAMQELPMFGLELLHDLETRLQRLKSRMGAS